MKIKYLFILVIAFSCASSNKDISSDFDRMLNNKNGTLLSINLKTNNHIRNGQKCFLDFKDAAQVYSLTLKEGLWDYALPFNQSEVEIVKFSCGTFYYYHLENQGAKFSLQNSKISYLGILNFTLEEKGQMEWGLATRSKDELRTRAMELGVDHQYLNIDILKI